MAPVPAMRRINPAGIAAPSIFFSQVVVVPPGASLIFVSGQIGIDAAGVLAADFAGQVIRAWSNLAACLTAGGATLDDLVQVRSYIVAGQDVAAFQQARRQFVPVEPPSSTVLFVPALLVEACLFEVEAIAAIRA
jgi:enamine deaminase RidA (YjgF/YER057c/UK114 family)